MSTALRLALFATLACVACQTVQPSEIIYGELDHASMLYDQGDYRTAAETVEQLLATTAKEPDEFAVQRFYAAYLATQIHLQACLTDPFLTERSYGGAPEPSRVAHAMAELMHASNGLAWSEGAMAAADDIAALVPPTLAEQQPEAVRTNLQLAILAAYAAMRFDDQASTLLQSPELGDTSSIEGWAQLMERVALPESVRPWVYVAVFRDKSKTDPREAFRYGMSSLVEGRTPDEWLNKSTVAEIEQWIEHHPKWEFRCKGCERPITPQLDACIHDNESYVNADPEERPTGG